MGRNTTSDKTPLLENAEQNIGNSAIILPQVGPVTTFPQTNPQRLLQLSGGSAVGQTTSVILTASRIVGADNPNPGYAGPITGVIEFGSGGRSTRVEVDVPIGPFIGTLTQALVATEPQDGGTIVTVPTSVLRAYLRYDNLLIQPVLAPNSPPVTMAQIAGVISQGPGAPIYTQSTPTVLVPPEPILGKAMSAYYSRHWAAAYKTQYLFVGAYNTNTSKVETVQVGQTFLGFILPYQFVLPAFTKSVKVLRWPLTTNLEVELINGIQQVDAVSIVSGTSAPIIPVIGHENIISIVSKTANDVVSFLALCCEIGI